MSDEFSVNAGGALRERTKAFAVRVVRLYSAMPSTTVAQTIGKQLLRSGTSVGAHYREGQRARSAAEFISKLEVALQELEETDYWIEILVETEVLPASRLVEMRAEIQELLAMLTARVKTVKSRKH